MANNNNNKTLNVPNLRFPEFSGEWKAERLNDITKLTKGVGISKDQLSESGEPCILYGELYTKYKSEIIDEVLSKTDIPTDKLMRSKANDVIIPCSGETAVDIATARCVSLDNVLLGGDLNIIRLKHHDGSFMSYQLNGKRKYDIAKVAQGVSVVHLYGEHLKGIVTYNPQLDEQKKIVSLLSLLDKRIATQNKIIEKLQSLILGIANQVCNSKVGNTLIKDCLDCHTSTIQESSVLEGGLYPVYGASGIAGYTNDYQVDEEAILIIKDGSGVGKVSYVEGKFSVIGTLNYLTAKESYSLRYLYYCLMAFNFKSYKTGMAIPHIYFKDYSKASVYCPKIENQEKVSETLSKIEEKLNIEKNIFAQLNEEKTYLLQKMFI